ncbi:MAG: hypothetical protein KA257_02200 [Opitutaceae bacterium]|jgi:2-oxoisovalerate dehydrogenase E1 component|nr:hypothetical protein [Opitutaceae bacterium]MBP9913127.1 hypothetical protein [Opitutaceae bacterium]
MAPPLAAADTPRRMPPRPHQAKPARPSAGAKKSAPTSPTRAELLRLYERMVLLRQFELAAQACYKRGEMPGFIHLYIGEEAVAVGVCAHLSDTDWITSTHRGHGHALAKGMPPRLLMAELFAKATGCCGGRGGSMHLYDKAHGVFGTNGIVGGGIAHAVGATLSARTRGTRDVAAAFFGDGAVNHGAFHESLNFAGAQQAGTLFVCENNLYATATPLKNVTRNPEIATRAAAYGVPGVAVDGNDVLAVWSAAHEAVARARRGDGPTLIEAKTYRVVGHHEGDPLTGVYRGQAELDAWKKRCPVATFRRRLLADLKAAKPAELAQIDARIDAIVADAVEFARNSAEPDPATVFTNCWSDAINPPLPASDPERKTTTQGWLDAVRDGLAEEMRRDPHVLYFGEGIGERGGSFAHTKGLWQEFGAGRVIDTPICELGFTGAAIGASATGCRSVADLMFVDFLFETGGQIPLQAAKLRYMSNGQMVAPLVVRAPCGAIKSAGPQHSGTYHTLWAHLPGLIVAMPSNPADAKGLMKTALRGDNPVLFLEPKALFASKGEVPVGEHCVPFGVARLAVTGRDLTLATIGRMVPLALEAAAALAQTGVHCEVIDLRTIVPLDLETIITSLTKTGRLLVVDEGYAAFGLGAEIAAAIGEQAFDLLDGPVGRLHLEPVPHPFNPKLEEAVLPDVGKIIAAAQAVLKGEPRPQRRPQAKPDDTEVVPPRRAVEGPAPSGPQIATNVQTPNRTTPRSSLPEAPAIEGERLTLPHGDLTVSEAKVVNWHKQVGDTFTAGEIIAEVETDKAVLEVEAPSAGRLTQIVAPVGTVVKMGGVLGVFAKP